jgi:hypothetical protein
VIIIPAVIVLRRELGIALGQPTREEDRVLAAPPTKGGSMALRSLLYLLGVSLTVAGCFFPWSCRQAGDFSWHCPGAIMFRYTMQNDGTNRLELQDSVRGSGFLVLFLAAIIIWFVFSPPQFIRRPKIAAMTSSAVLVLVSAYQFIIALSAQIQNSDAFTGFTILTLAIVCIGALLTLVAGAIDQCTARQYAA